MKKQKRKEKVKHLKLYTLHAIIQVREIIPVSCEVALGI